ncbi:hypothetical protein BV22DRAFT_622844 [Leucogyrophana mollusca]|uniref:Uncharacterized protein n=1 Tax=Leucogyrophana mollusca TaxID=85980 RepID=A0ACB8BCM9_9AGAM|nr:hypothetical protein BV22DRAFT_622844 [Leucogyrophana mollusca]
MDRCPLFDNGLADHNPPLLVQPPQIPRPPHLFRLYRQPYVRLRQEMKMDVSEFEQFKRTIRHSAASCLELDTPFANQHPLRRAAFHSQVKKGAGDLFDKFTDGWPVEAYTTRYLDKRVADMSRSQIHPLKLPRACNPQIRDQNLHPPAGIDEPAAIHPPAALQAPAVKHKFLQAFLASISPGLEHLADALSEIGFNEEKFLDAFAARPAAMRTEFLERKMAGKATDVEIFMFNEALRTRR